MVEHNVLLFGGSGSGKTTLLASMVSVSNTLLVRGRQPLQVYPDEGSADFLFTAAAALKDAFVAGERESQFRVIDHTQKATKYRIHIARRGQQTPMMSLDFVDTPGEWTEKTAKGEMRQKLSDSRAAILAVDAVELFHRATAVPIGQRRNAPATVHFLVQQWLQAMPHDDLLLCIVPLKVETLLRPRAKHDHEKGAEMLSERLKEDYELLLAELDHDESSRRVAVVMCPAQTVGNLIFHTYKPDPAGGYPSEIWQRIRGYPTDAQPETGYAPVDTDQPMRHILNWLLIAEIKQKRGMNESDWSRFIRGALGIFDKEAAESYDWLRSQFLDIFGRDQDLARSVAQFIKGSKTLPPFEIIQGHDLITRESVLWDLFAK